MARVGHGPVAKDPLMSFPGSNTTAGAKLINWPGIRANLLQGAREGLEMALDQCVRDAKEKAPVRDVFAGGSHGRAGLEKINMASGKPGAARMGHPALMAERGTKVIRKTAAAQAEFMEALKAQSLPRHRSDIVNVSRSGSDLGGSTRFTTHHRDFDPVLMDPGGEKRRPPHGFRDITGMLPEAGIKGLPLQAMAGGPHLRGPAIGRDRPELAPMKTIEDYLSAKGKYEVGRIARVARSGAPLTGTTTPHLILFLMKRGARLEGTALHRTATGDVTLGGRLRDEIHRTGTRMTSQTISGWVVSPTPYAKYQEWGTSRHRPQPYMRPALYKARSNLPRLVMLHLGRKLR
jgi:HK97 gp10 family phage protein